MITKQTVFILGAGASSPYGFPLGCELRHIIIDNLKQSNNNFWVDHLINLGFSLHDIASFRNRFLYSGLSSIDVFLERSTDFQEIGKFAIALGIGHCENDAMNSFYGKNPIGSAFGLGISQRNDIKESWGITTENYDVLGFLKNVARFNHSLNN